MNLEQIGDYRIAASRDRVWAALNDPLLLQRCIDGCQSMEQTADNRFYTVVRAKIGPDSALFDADVELCDLNPPESYTINTVAKSGAKGGPAGFCKGSASVQLTQEGESTQLSYAVYANFGGQLAQIGSRLIDSAARKMADNFFAKFEQELVARPELGTDRAPQPETSGQAEPETSEQTEIVAEVAEDEQTGFQPSQQGLIWAIMFGVLLLAVVLTL